MYLNALLKTHVPYFDVKFTDQKITKSGFDGVVVSTGRKMAQEIKGLWLLNHSLTVHIHGLARNDHRPKPQGETSQSRACSTPENLLDTSYGKQ